MNQAGGRQEAHGEVKLDEFAGQGTGQVSFTNAARTEQQQVVPPLDPTGVSSQGPQSLGIELRAVAEVEVSEALCPRELGFLEQTLEAIVMADLKFEFTEVKQELAVTPGLLESLAFQVALVAAHG